MDAVISPVFHKYVVPVELFSVTLSPVHKVVDPPAVMIGAAGVAGCAFTVTEVVPGETQPLALREVTV